MKRTKILSSIILFQFTLLFTNHQASSTNIFLVKETNGSISVEVVEVAENRVQVFNDPSIVTIVLPLSEGLAGDLIFKKSRDRKIIVQNKNGEILTKIITGDNQKSLPAANIQSLLQYKVKVNITGGDGSKAAFLIKNNKSFEKVDGPVVDMFGGQVPMKSGDYAITLETSVAKEEIYLIGEAQYQVIDNWIVTKIELQSGKTGKFVVDCAASTSIVSKSFLPDDANIRKVIATEYNSDKASEKQGEIKAATGEVTGDQFLGKFTFENTKLGSMNLPAWDANVLKELPSFMQQHNLDGIIGLNILSSAKIFQISNLQSSLNQKLEFKKETNPTGNSLAISFQVVRKLLISSGAINGKEINWLLDTGARRSIISSSFVKENNISFSEVDEEVDPLSGLGGVKVDAKKIQLENVKIGQAQFENMKIVKSDLAVFKSFGIDNAEALLGMDFFNNYNNVYFDFQNNFLILE